MFLDCFAACACLSAETLSSASNETAAAVAAGWLSSLSSRPVEFGVVVEVDAMVVVCHCRRIISLYILHFAGYSQSKPSCSNFESIAHIASSISEVGKERIMRKSGNAL